MRQELQQKLFNKYPRIFADKDKSMQATAMCWGIECGDGWYGLLDSLCGCVQEYIDYNDAWQIVASQVKEKYGGLRFYYDGGDDMIDGMVWFAEHDSYNTCEQCGSTANVKQSEGGWIFTRCDQCTDSVHFSPTNKKSTLKRFQITGPPDKLAALRNWAYRHAEKAGLDVRRDGNKLVIEGDDVFIDKFSRHAERHECSVTTTKGKTS